MKKYFTLLGLLLLIHNSFAQHQEIAEKPEIWKGKTNINIDSTSLLSVFKKGSFNGHFRYFNMNTINEGSLTDYHANAFGGGVKFETAKFHNFQFGVSGYYIYDIGSSDFLAKDPTTNQTNRYEIALFDIKHPDEKENLSRLEELYLKFNFKKSTFTLGKQLLNSSFINLQDGRMRPTEVAGIWVDFNEIKNTTINTGYLYAISPRSTEKYYDIGESIGIYPAGVNPDGTKSGYATNLESNGIYILGLQNESVKNLKALVFNQYVENIFNTTLLQFDYKKDLNKNSKLLFGFQTIYQTAINDGGNSDQSKTYFEKDAKSQTFGGKLGWKSKTLEVTLNYNRITDRGRYLMPREWGRDPFYTFLPRERNEGFGDVTAYMTKISYYGPKKTFKAYIGVGHYKMPDVKNFKMNKYALPSYYQTNFDVSYDFQGFLKGFDAHFLYVHKFNDGETYNDPKNVFNKTNMSTINFIINFNF